MIARKLSINRPYFKDVVYFIVRDWKEGKMKSAIAPYARQVEEADCVGDFSGQEHKGNVKPTTSANCRAQGWRRLLRAAVCACHCVLLCVHATAHSFLSLSSVPL